MKKTIVQFLERVERTTLKKSILIILIFFSVLQISAQKFALSGKITDSENNALPGASVQIKNSFIGTSTNNEGNYKISNLNAGNHTILISYIGFKTIEKQITIDKDLEQNFQLEIDTILSKEIVINGIRANQNTPVAQTNISKEEISKNNIVADIPYLLELTPSVVSSSENGTGIGYTSMRIRGTDMSRINVTVNGIPFNDSESQGVYWVDLPDLASSVNKIQIQRGVGTSTNGAASFGASINFQTLNLESKPYTQINSSFGSFKTFKRNISAGTGLINDKFAFDVRYSKLNSDGWIQRGFSDHESFYVSGSYLNKNNFLKAVVMLGKERTGITWWGVPDYMIDSIRNFNPAGEYVDNAGKTQHYAGETDNYWQNHYHLLYTHEFSRYLKLNAALHATSGKGYYEQYKTGETLADYGILDTTILSSDLINQKWMDNIFYGATATLTYEKNNLNLCFGTAANQYDGNHFGLVKWVRNNDSIPQDYEWYRNVGNKTDINAFAKAQYNFTEKLSFFGDVQFRHINYELSGPDDDLKLVDQKHNWNFINPKAGISYILNKSMQTYISFAVANREPARADLKDSQKDGSTYVPKHETLYDFEAGYNLKKEKYAISANVFYMMYDNQLVLTGKLTNVGYPLMENVKNSFRRGIEFSFGSKICKKLEWNGNVAYSQNKIKNYTEYSFVYDNDWNETLQETNLGTTNISYSPDFVASTSIFYNPMDDLQFGLTGKYVSSQFLDNTNDENRKLEAYMVFNFKIDYNFEIKDFSKLKVQFLINNILNKDYISNGYGGNWYEQGTEKSWIYYYPQAGRNFMVKLSMNF